MALSHGMQRDAVMGIAGQLDADQQTVADLIQRTQVAVDTLSQNWFGQDSTQFAADWSGQARQLQMAVDAIMAMSREVRTQASDQQSTSTA